MTPLLRKWSEHEPERCRFEGDICFLNWRLREPGDTTKPEQHTAMTRAAVIDAIEARGWDWNLTSMLPWSATARRYMATVTYHVKEADSDVAALLTAYLAALEAEGEEQA